MRLLNLTPHRLHVIDVAGATLVDLPPAADPARITQEVVDERFEAAGVPLRTIRYGAPTWLPAPTEGVLLVVSRVVAQQISRPDLVFPDDEVRDARGRVVACRALARFHRG